MPLVAVGYRRVSTEEQKTGHSLDAQQRAIEEYIARKGWQAGPIYTDAGLSGTFEQRPALQRLLHDAERGKFDVVIVHAIDRFYRSLGGLLRAMDLLSKHKVSFVSITENLDFTTPWGKLTLAVLGTLAEIYIDKLKAETRKGLLERAKKGLHNGSAPLGYCKGTCSVCADPNGPGYCPYAGGEDRGDGKVLIPHPIEKTAVQLAFAYSTGEHLSDGEIAARLNAHRHQLPTGEILPLRSKRHSSRGGPGPFGKDSVRDILMRVFYTGLVPYYGVNEKGQKRKRRDAVALYPGLHQPLISQEQFEQAQRNRELLRRRPRRREGKPVRIYPLSGILFCAQCGGKMRAHRGSQGRSYYACVTRLQRTGVCRQPSVRFEKLEEALYTFFRQIEIPSDWEHRLLRQMGRDPAEIARREAEIKNRLSRASELYLAGLLSKERFEGEKRNFENAIADLRIEGIPAIINARNQLTDLQARWFDLEPLNQKKLLQGLVAAVFVRGDALEGIRFTEQFYPIVKQIFGEKFCFYNGSDGRGLFQK